MEEILFGLTPSEWWVWNYMIYLARKQGGLIVTLPRPGEDVRAEKVFCRKHLKNLLKSLKSKRKLTNLIIPRSKSKKIEVFLPASKIGELGFLNVEKGLLEYPNKEGRGNWGSPKRTLGKNQAPINPGMEHGCGLLPTGKLKLKEVIEKLLELKQVELKKAITEASSGELMEVEGALGVLVRRKPKGKKLSVGARVFAMVRFLQSGSAVEKPQAWIDNVARAVEAEIWKGESSDASGRSPSLERSEGRSTSSWGRS